MCCREECNCCLMCWMLWFCSCLLRCVCFCLVWLLMLGGLLASLFSWPWLGLGLALAWPLLCFCSVCLSVRLCFSGFLVWVVFPYLTLLWNHLPNLLTTPVMLLPLPVRSDCIHATHAGSRVCINLSRKPLKSRLSPIFTRKSHTSPNAFHKFSHRLALL